MHIDLKLVPVIGCKYYWKIHLLTFTYKVKCKFIIIDFFACLHQDYWPIPVDGDNISKKFIFAIIFSDKA